MNTEELFHLTSLPGVSGNEKCVADYVKSELGGICEISEDVFGNVYAVTKGKKRKKKVAFFAHMDEVGLMITSVNGSFASFDTVGGINKEVLYGKRVTVNGKTGVINVKPVHLCSDDEKKTVPSHDNMKIDFGADAGILREGDFASFLPVSFVSGENLFSKALDDRIGVYALIELAKSEPEYETTLVFTRCEETGTQGAAAAQNKINADIAVVLECTTAADLPYITTGKAVTRLGSGVVISKRDAATVYDKELYSLACAVADKAGIPHQTKTDIAGGNDARAVSQHSGGCRTAAFSLAARNLHSPVSSASKADAEGLLLLTKLFCNSLGDGEKWIY